MPKNWCLWTIVLEKTLESPLDCKETKPVNPKGNQSWIFTGRTDAEAPILWPPDAKRRLIEKRPCWWEWLKAGEKGVTEGKMVGWHHRLSGLEFEQTLGDDEGKGILVCCSPWGHRVRHNVVTETQQIKIYNTCKNLSVKVETNLVNLLNLKSDRHQRIHLNPINVKQFILFSDIEMLANYSEENNVSNQIKETLTILAFNENGYRRKPNLKK